MDLDIEKLKAAMVYLVGRAKEPPGKVQLFKWLYLADFNAYRKSGSPITGETYVNFEGGPVPRTLWRNYLSLVSECLAIEKVEIGLPFPKEEMRPKAGIDQAAFAARFSEEERAILDDVLQRFGSMSGSELKRLTHEDVPYRMTRRGDVIPYYLAHYRDYRPATDAEVEKYLDANDTRQVLAELIKTSDSE